MPPKKSTFPMLFGLAYDPVSDIAFGKLEPQNYGQDPEFGSEYFM